MKDDGGVDRLVIYIMSLFLYLCILFYYIFSNIIQC